MTDEVKGQDGLRGCWVKSLFCVPRSGEEEMEYKLEVERREDVEARLEGWRAGQQDGGAGQFTS